MSQNEPSKSDELKKRMDHYLATNPIIRRFNSVKEFEIRFGSNPKVAKPISKIDYDNVAKKVKSCGFVPENVDGYQYLRINPEFYDEKKGKYKISSIRAEIVGDDMIREYCQTNSIDSLVQLPGTTNEKVKFREKSSNVDGPNTPYLKPIDFPDFNYRVSYQLEREYMTHSERVREITAKWKDTKKLFRYMNRVRFVHPDIPIFIDMSIVKSSKRTKSHIPIPQYTIQDADVMNSAETYEIEIEIDNNRVGTATPYEKSTDLIPVLRKVIRMVLCGIQDTTHHISYVERNRVLTEYMKLLHGDDFELTRQIRPRDFIGPGSVTLQMSNIVETDATSNVPNIRMNYAVTDKADGERRLLYVAKETGKIYMIDTNMNVRYTGCSTDVQNLHNSLLDGEHIKYDKNQKFIHLYAAFDIYYYNGKSTREMGLFPTGENDDPRKFRMPILQFFVEKLKPKMVFKSDSEEVANFKFWKMSENKETGSKKWVNSKTGEIRLVEPEMIETKHFRIEYKTFYMGSLSVESNTTTTMNDMSIFQAVQFIMTKNKNAGFEYNTDGVIFTPINTGVGSSKIGSAGPLYKKTWKESFKWKPAEYNTVDFLVTVKKDKTGKDELHHIFQDGINANGQESITQYKTLVLMSGYNKSEHGYLNPFNDMVEDKIPNPDDLDNEDKYKPVPFQPSQPYDPNACFCNVILKNNGKQMIMTTAEHDEYFEEDMIVEFKYEMNAKPGWNWVPLRVRYDKTAELRSGQNNFGNPYHVANDNWQSIHNPITEDMITTGLNIPTFDSTQVYYNTDGQSSTNNTVAMRNFHNRYVKNKLIGGVAKPGNLLIDYAVGKAGDMPKWIQSKLDFVFGIDKAKMNIHNTIDGACARYLNERRTHRQMTDALFVVGNSSLNIRSGKAFSTDKDKQISAAIFGSGPKDAQVLGHGVYKQYGIGESGFHISSCQFALHYFFESPATINSFMRNLAECTRLNGYFIGTCYDGKRVFELLKNKNMGETYVITSDDNRICEITKQYPETGFPDDDLSIGYAVDVTQESINNTLREYLVNFTYLTRILNDYGFVLVPDSEAIHMGFKKGTGLFDELFALMDEEIKKNPQKKSEYKNAQYMTTGERKLSFLNRYFIFKKVRSVDAKKIEAIVLRKEQIIEMTEPGSEQINTDQINTEQINTDQINSLEKRVETEFGIDIPKSKPKPKLRIKNKTKMVLLNDETPAAAEPNIIQEINEINVDEPDKEPMILKENKVAVNKPKLRIKPKK